MASEAIMANTEKSVFLPNTEPELNSINFRESLKFFQEQLILNGKGFPSPNHVKKGNGFGKYTLVNIPGVQNKQSVSEIAQNEVFHGDIKDASTLNSCQIKIPTVDTILESVRILRAIQKSQEERNALKSLDSCTTNSIDNSQTFDSLSSFTDIDGSYSFEVSFDHGSTNKVNEMLIENFNPQQYNAMSFSSSVNSICSFWPSNTILSEDISTNKQILKEIGQAIDEKQILNSKTVLESKFDNSLNKNERYDNQQSTCPLEKTTESLESDFLKEQNLHTDSFNESIEDSHDSLNAEDKSLKLNISQENLKAQYVIAFMTEPSSPNPNNIDMHSKMSKTFQSSYIPEEHSKKKSSIDGDSGIYRSPIFGSSPTSPYRMDSCSDTCSSLYVSAESSPCPSLSSLLDSSLGFSSYITNHVSDSLETEYHENMWEDMLQLPSKENKDQIKDLSIVCDKEYHENEAGQKHHFVTYSPVQTTTQILQEDDINLKLIETKEEIKNVHEESTVCDWMDPNIIYDNEKRTPEQPQIPADVVNTVNDSLNFLINKSNILKIPDEVHDTKSEFSYVSEIFQNEEIKATDSSEKKDILILDKSDETILNPVKPNLTNEMPNSSVVAEETNIKEQEVPNSKTFTGTKIIENTETVNSDNPDNIEISLCNGSELNLECQLLTNHKEIIKNGVINTGYELCNNTEEENSFSSFTSIDLVYSGSMSKEHTNKSEDNSVKKTGENLEHINNQNEKIETNIDGEIVENRESDIEIIRHKKITSASWEVLFIMDSLYEMRECRENVLYEVKQFEREIYILSKGAFSNYTEGIYTVSMQNSSLQIMSQDSEVLHSIMLIHSENIVLDQNILMIDNKMGRCLYFQFNTLEDLIKVKEEIELYCSRIWQFECIKVVHYPLKCHQDVIIIDLGSCSTRAGILMDQPTLPMLFFPSICAKDKITGNCVYGMEALHPEVRQTSNLSFPIRDPVKISKHLIDIDVLGGLFKKILTDLHVDPTKFIVQLCLPRSINVTTQNAIVKLLLEDLKVAAVSLTNQALLSLYAHDVSTAVIVNIGERMDILPVVDGFKVENGVTKLPYGGQRIIHHMKHALAAKHIGLSSEIDSFVVQYIMEKSAYVAMNFDSEAELAIKNPDIIKKSINLQKFTTDNSVKEITIDEARFKITEGLFKPEIWGLDNPGIHELVQKAIQATGVDARKEVAENIYVSGGVTMLPGFVERLSQEVALLSKTKVMPKVFASNYRYHCAYIGACKFAKMKEFPQVCVNLAEYNDNCVESLKKFVLSF